MKFIGGRNVKIYWGNIVEFNDCPDGPGTTWVWEAEEKVLSIVSDTDHPDGIAAFPSADAAAEYIDRFYGDDRPVLLDGFLDKIREEG